MLIPEKYVNWMPFAMFISMIAAFSFDLSIYLGILFYLFNFLCLLRAFSGIIHILPQTGKEWIIYSISYLIAIILVIIYNAILEFDIAFNIILLLPYFWLLFTLIALSIINLIYYCDKLYRKFSFAIALFVGLILFVIYSLLVVFNSNYLKKETNQSVNGSAGVILMYPIYKMAQVSMHTSVLWLHGIWHSHGRRDDVAVKSLIQT